MARRMPTISLLCGGSIGRPNLSSVFKSHIVEMLGKIKYPCGLTKEQFHDCVCDFSSEWCREYDECYEYLLDYPSLVHEWMVFKGLTKSKNVGSNVVPKELCLVDDYGNIIEGLGNDFPWEDDIDDWGESGKSYNVQDIDDMGFDEYKGHGVPRGSVVDMEGNILSVGDGDIDGSLSSWVGNNNNKSKKGKFKNKELDAMAMSEEGRWHCTIEYYDNPLNLNKYSVFNSLRAFSKFCEREKIVVDSITLKELVENGKSYCCLDVFDVHSRSLVAYDDIKKLKDDADMIYGHWNVKGGSSKKRGSRGKKGSKTHTSKRGSTIL